MFENLNEKKNNFQKIKLIFNSIFYIELKECIFVEISRIKLLFEPPLRGVDDTKGGPISNCLKMSRAKNNINFLKIELIFNSIFYIELNEYTFVEISLIKLLFEPSLRGVVDTKEGPLSNCLRISRAKKILIFKKLNSFLIVYFI